MPSFTFDVEFEHRRDGNSSFATVPSSVEMERASCEATMGKLGAIVAGARTEAARQIMAGPGFDAGGADVETIAKDLLVGAVVRQGPKTRFDFLGTYPTAGGGNFNEFFEAVDADDAEFGGRWLMAENIGMDPNEDGVDFFVRAMDSMSNTSVMAAPVPERDMIEMLAELQSAAVAAGADADVTDRAAEMLRKLGKEPASAPGPSR